MSVRIEDVSKLVCAIDGEELELINNTYGQEVAVGPVHRYINKDGLMVVSRTVLMFCAVCDEEDDTKLDAWFAICTMGPDDNDIYGPELSIELDVLFHDFLNEEVTKVYLDTWMGTAAELVKEVYRLFIERCSDEIADM